MKAFALVVFILLTSSSIWAQEGILNKLLAPGPLVKGHSQLERSDCLKCHQTGKGVQDSKCLECHKPLQRSVVNKAGFHGLTTQSCRECHKDHQGRNALIMQLDEKNFDHKKSTGYSLEGKHSSLKCQECHKSKLPSTFVQAGHTRYFGSQSTTCVSCHKKDDIHFFKGTWAQKDCVTCHSLTSWKKDVKFDHEKDAKYRLEGNHKDLKCATCHGPNKQSQKVVYTFPTLKSAQCLACHADQHDGNFSAKFSGGKCLTCHTQTEWKIDKFDHAITKYSLQGKHSELQCTECHVQKDAKLAMNQKNFKFAGLRQACLTCHKDFHLFGALKTKHFGAAQNCKSCHTEKSWKEVTQFNHDKDTRYPLRGEHLKLKCMECHTQKSNAGVVKKAIYTWPQLTTKTCENCHKSPHAGQFSTAVLKKQCTECHVTSGWLDTKGGQTFNHNQTRFPLTGAHKQIHCGDCHGEKGKQVFKFKSPEQKFCLDCHQNIHNKQFSAKTNTTNCTQCHTTENFKTRLDFNHAETNYPLEGAHKTVKCETCHVRTANTVMLSPPNISKSSKPLDRQLQMSQFQFPKNAKDNCLTCHADTHKSQLGIKCLNCHNMAAWKPVRFVHNTQSNFILAGKHQDLKCQECHKNMPGQFTKVGNENHPVVHYKPISGQCLTCHKDAHQGAFGTNCRECHIEKGWKYTKDFHKNFTLTGVHYSLQCSECHRENRKLSGLSQQCLTCHAKDDVHRGTLPACQECHRQQFWEVTGFKHSLTQFPLRGVHRTLDCMECHRGGTYKGLASQCSSCHLQTALAVTSPNHAAFGNLTSCNSCHLNQFSWK